MNVSFPVFIVVVFPVVAMLTRYVVGGFRGTFRFELF